jgi:serine/threonine-protein kinase OSR1/STK39
MPLNEEISASAEGSFAPDVTWPVQATAYNIISKIGKGAFATVYKATVHTESLSKPKYCAIKVIDLENVNTNFVDIRQEVQTMRLCNHPNIVVYHIR